jgi:hypothetical protein
VSALAQNCCSGLFPEDVPELLDDELAVPRLEVPPLELELLELEEPELPDPLELVVDLVLPELQAQTAHIETTVTSNTRMEDPG